MAYFTRDKRKVIIEVFTSIDVVRNRLLNEGYAFSENTVYGNHFWGTRFLVEKPVGKGATARLRYLFEEVAR